MLIKKLLYFSVFIISLLLALTTFYIEFRILSEMVYFEEPSYDLPYYNIKLKGTTATLAHLANIIFGVMAIALSVRSYNKLKK